MTEIAEDSSVSGRAGEDRGRSVKRYIVRDSLQGVTFATLEVIWARGGPRDRSLTRGQAKKLGQGTVDFPRDHELWGWNPRGGKKGEGSFLPVEIVGEVEIDTSLAARWSKVRWRECSPVDSANWNNVVGAVHEEIVRELNLEPDAALSFSQGTDAGGWRTVTLFFPSKCYG